MIAEKLGEAIRQSGLKQKFIAREAGISENALSAMLNGRQKIDVDTFIEIARVLKKTPDQICGIQKSA